MTASCQVTTLSPEDFPELYQFYQFSSKHYPFLLSSTSQSAPTDTSVQHSDSNFDILFIRPTQWLMLDPAFCLSASDGLDIDTSRGFLDNLNRIYQTQAQTPSGQNKHLPFYGGWFVFLAYELAQEVEPVLRQSFAKSCKDNSRVQKNLPIAYAARVQQALIFDHRQQQLFFVSENELDHQQALQQLQQDAECIRTTSDDATTQLNIKVIQEENEQSFLNSVAQVRQYIRDGDVFQVNMSRLWQARLDETCSEGSHSQWATNLFKTLSQANPAPFAGLATFDTPAGQASIISSSPERLLSIRNNYLESRPIAGTHPRGASEAEDRRLLERLHNHPKEQAEHIMLIDLIRNDLGRVCVPGTVKVDELMVNESYAHVHHIVSNVVGELEQNKTPVDAIKAMFPGGTITGCPKVRCMEIIAELEQCPRGAYTGSMGYINRDGSMDLNILIRTMVLEAQEKLQLLSFRAGAGLVFDSIAERELQETRSKAKGLLNALKSNPSLL